MLGAALDEHADQFAIGVIEGDITTDLDAANGRGTQVSLLNNQHGFAPNATSTHLWSTAP